jgi:hypothetical protein
VLCWDFSSPASPSGFELHLEEVALAGGICLGCPADLLHPTLYDDIIGA